MNQFTASLWGDEAWAATLAVKSYTDIIRIVARDTSPPLYYVLLHTWMSFLGTSEVAIRSLSFLFFLGTAITVYFIGKHLWDKKTGVLAAVLTFLNPFLFNYAFEGRMYSLLVFTSTLSVYFFLTRKKIPFILSTTAALYTHHFAIFIVFFEALWRLLENRKNVRDFFIVGLLYLPWFYPLYYQTSLVGSGFWLGRPTFTDLRETIQKFLVGTGREPIRQYTLWATLAVLFLRNWGKNIAKSAFLLGWFSTPLLVVFFLSQKFQPIFYDRYLQLGIPGAMLLAASPRRGLRSWIGLGLRNLPFLIIIPTLAYLNFTYFSQPTKRPFRELARYVKAEAPNLPLINYNAAAHHLWEAKYYGLKAPIYAPKPLPFYTGTALMGSGDTIATLPEASLIVVITSAPINEVSLPNYSFQKYQQFSDLKLIWMEKE